MNELQIPTQPMATWAAANGVNVELPTLFDQYAMAALTGLLAGRCQAATGSTIAQHAMDVAFDAMMRRQAVIHKCNELRTTT